SRLVTMAGANYVARWTTAHPFQASRSIKAALEHEGFTFIEMLSQCPTAYGRRAKIGDSQDFFDWFKSLRIRKKGEPLHYRVPTKENIDLGVFVDRNEKGYKPALSETVVPKRH
ncbi:MAG: 2-oxoacid:ferredoxin oxidoreductase subunit beta, partial [Promethearchaeati archaeon]